MNQNTQYFSKEEKNTKFLSVIENLEKDINNTNSGFISEVDFSFIPGGTFFSLLNLLQPKSKEEETLFSLLYQYCSRAEKISAGSGLIAFYSFYKAFWSLCTSNQSEYTDINLNQLEDLIGGLIGNSVKPFNRDNLKSFLEDFIKDREEIVVLLKELLETSGLRGNISVEQNMATEEYQIETYTGYRFNCSAYYGFLHSVLQYWERNNVKVLIVDGILEKVSEIDNFLIGANKSKQPLLIIAQGFEEEVLATIKVNNDKKLFDVMPVLIPPELNNLNVCIDIAIACGSQPISTLNGQILSVVNYNDLPVVDSVKLLEKSLLIKAKTFNSVATHIKGLYEKRKEKEQEKFTAIDLASLFDNRINSLMNYSIVLRIPAKSTKEFIAQKVLIDSFLRTIKTKTSYGLLKTKELGEILSLNQTKNIVKDTMKHSLDKLSEKEFIDHSSFIVGNYYGIKLAYEVYNLAGWVYNGKF